MKEQGVRIRVRGQVQGVGFRPFVWRLASERGLRGQVWNDPEGVGVELFGEIGDFLAALRAEAPPLARIDAVEAAPFEGAAPAGFTITPSRGHGAQTRVAPDAASCPDCVAESLGRGGYAGGRRAGYAFTNCTHCGPRFSILRGLPYDRGETTMAGFAMCPACRAEYENPADRRFHAQPIACPVCGPRVWYEEGGAEVAGDAVAEAAVALRAGKIIAIKGIGGFHLACDARDPGALTALRVRKRRPAKPFALMAREGDLGAIVALSEPARAALRAAAAPVVLCPALAGALPEAVAPGMVEYGVMLPYTPLHHLLLEAFGGVLVMTSGNLSGEPQVIENAEAREKLAGFVDGFLMHDRPIARRLDDSVLRAEPAQVLRHARGRVPDVIALPEGFGGAEIVALGGQMKGAICLIKNGQALLGHHLGDLDGALCFDEFEKAVADYRALFEHRPERVAVDAHPGYRATQAGQAMGLPVAEVWHHHAHLAACLGENLWPLAGGQVAAIVLDGTGLGPDGTLWGGEVLLGDYKGFSREAHLRPAPLAGGDRAAREPWRNAVMRLDQAGLGGAAEADFAGLAVAPLRAAARAGVNAPLSSSAGRLFDAVAALLGICPAGMSFEGEAAMRLEALARAGEGRAAAALPAAPAGPVIDPAPMIAALMAARAVAAPEALAFAFHRWLAEAFAARARALVEAGRARAVVLSGGVYQNALLHRLSLAALKGLPVLTHAKVPANDGGLALGQALIAAAQLSPGPEST